MQISLFDGANKFIIDKPIRLIELFAGYGSQHFALDYLGVKCKSHKICEWAVKSIQAYKDAHFKDDNTDYSKDHSKEFIFNRLSKWGISSNYNEPMTKEQVKRLGEEKARTIYNNIKATHNLVNIQQVHGEDLEITDTDKYCYVMTYSFPCQDLSSAGLGKGMEKGSGTRSGMLWEVERILDELKTDNNELPQVLLMENVPEVIGTNNIKHFAKWLEKLESLGYKCYWKVLNAKDYGIPQNRERCFMVSILGDYYYDFPEQQKLELRLKDLLEDEVDEKYYLSDKMIKSFNEKEMFIEKGTGKHQTNSVYREDNIARSLCACDYKQPMLVMQKLYIKGKECAITKENDNFIEWKQKGLLDSDCRAWKDNKVSGTLTCKGNNKILEGVVVKNDNKRLKTLVEKTEFGEETMFLDCYNQKTLKDTSTTITTRIDDANHFVYNNLRIRKLTPKECFRLMGVKDNDYYNIAQNQSNASLYHLAGDSIVIQVLMAIFKEMLC